MQNPSELPGDQWLEGRLDGIVGTLLAKGLGDQELEELALAAWADAGYHPSDFAEAYSKATWWQPLTARTEQAARDSVRAFFNRLLELDR